jgi:hypothetical protein
MSKKAFDKIAAGLNDAIAIARCAADRATYRVHVPADEEVHPDHAMTRAVRRRRPPRKESAVLPGRHR